MRRSALCLLLLLAAGCAASSPAPAPQGPPCADQSALLAGSWTRPQTPLALRGDFALRLGGRDFDGLLAIRLAPGGEQADVLVMSPMGLTVLDLALGPQTTTLRRALPALEPAAAPLAAALRRIFLLPPGPDDPCLAAGSERTLFRNTFEGPVACTLAAPSGEMLAKSGPAAGGFRVRYGDYAPAGGATLPGSVGYADGQGLGLTLRLEAMTP